ncbi:MAG: ExeM/NucH family extracellular endonuclease [Shewanella sp.]|nr:ExeM/NucH family extracellular endonuclease [Shewanella sp.]
MRNINKLTAVAAAVTATLSCAVNADVMITEYVEGSSNNKAIEIHNSGAASADLSEYSLAYFSNGETDPTKFKVIEALIGTLAAGETKVIINSRAGDDLKNQVDASARILSGKVYFNGDDPVALIKGGIVTDIYGEFPVVKDDKKYENQTVRRDESVTTANPVFDASEWLEALPQDTFDGLGERTNVEPEPVVPYNCEGAELTFIHDIQGSSATSPLITSGIESADEVTVKGVVTARGESLQKGFYLQDIELDGDSSTSDGIFVYMKTAAPEAIQPGVEVCVTAKVKEFYNQTQLDLAADATRFEVLSTDGEVPAATPLVINDGETLDQALERYEGMKIVLDAGSEMKITRTLSRDYAASRNNMVASYKSPLFKATQLFMAGTDEAAAQEEANRKNELFLESDYKAADGELPYMEDFNAETGYVRVGDQVTNLEGMVGYSYGNYRLIVGDDENITAGDFIRNEDRTDEPTIANEGDLRVASFNVLNYFNDSVGGDASASGQNRGSKDQFEFRLQREKIVNAIVSMNSDIVGLMEIGNNGFGEKSALQDLVNALNAELSDEEAYSFVTINAADMHNEKFLGSDAIMVGLLYRTAKVIPAGDALVIKTPEQHAPAGAATRGEDDAKESSPKYDKYQRFSLAQTFTIGEEKLTVVVNHLKSKGSACLEDWIAFESERSDPEPADLQGHCNSFRVSAADALGQALENVDGDVLIIGDLNAYGKEDPLQVLTDYHPSTHEDKIIKTAAHTTLNGEAFDQQQRIITESYGYVNLNTELHGADTYSYSYSGELGNLDHALASKGLAGKVIAIEDWHINAVESNMFEYGSKYTGDLVKSGNAFSSSDHDPVIVAIDLPDPVVTPEPKPETKSSSGSLGFFSLALLSLFGFRRRR